MPREKISWRVGLRYRQAEARRFKLAHLRPWKRGSPLANLITAQMDFLANFADHDINPDRLHAKNCSSCHTALSIQKVIVSLMYPTGRVN